MYSIWICTIYIIIQYYTEYKIEETMTRLICWLLSSSSCRKRKLLSRHCDASFVIAARCYWSSIGFSGAGFLTCYHIGAVQCLMDQNYLPSFHHQDDDAMPTLTGVSGGGLIASAISAGVSPDDGMEALLTLCQQNQNQTLDAFTPG